MRAPLTITLLSTILCTVFFLRVSDHNATVYAQTTGQFRFVAWGDTKDNVPILSSLSNQAKLFNPKFTLYAGDLESSGFTAGGMDAWKNAINGGSNNGLFDITFPVRGNHDKNNTAAWQAYFDLRSHALRIGATNYTEMSADLTYSFDYGNSRFIGVDVPGDAGLLTDPQITWIEGRLADAQSKNLMHAFVYWHGPLYCTGGHCTCSTVTGCISSQGSKFIQMVNKYPILTAVFFGHEHTYAYVKMDNRRIPAITNPFDQFVVGDAGAGPDPCQPNRCDYNMSAHGFVTVDVNGGTITVNFYRQGSQTPVKTYTISKSGATPPVSNPPPTTGPTAPRGSTGLGVSIFLHGIGASGDNVNPTSVGNMNPLHPARQITLELTSANNAVTTAAGTVTFRSGTSEFSNTLPLSSSFQTGPYIIRAIAEGYLAKAFPGIQTVTSGQIKTLPAIELVAGDTNKDNRLNILDYTMILDCYADLNPTPRNCADAAKKQITDLTDDGNVNAFDYNLFLRELSVQSGQ